MGLELYPMTKGAKRQAQPAKPVNAAGDKDAVKRFVSSIAGATNLAGLRIVGKSIADARLGPDAAKSLKPLYSAKMHELEMEVMAPE